MPSCTFLLCRRNAPRLHWLCFSLLESARRVPLCPPAVQTPRQSAGSSLPKSALRSARLPRHSPALTPRLNSPAFRLHASPQHSPDLETLGGSNPFSHPSVLDRHFR